MKRKICCNHKYTNSSKTNNISEEKIRGKDEVQVQVPISNATIENNMSTIDNQNCTIINGKDISTNNNGEKNANNDDKEEYGDFPVFDFDIIDRIVEEHQSKMIHKNNVEAANKNHLPGEEIQNQQCEQQQEKTKVANNQHYIAIGNQLETIAEKSDLSDSGDSLLRSGKENKIQKPTQFDTNHEKSLKKTTSKVQLPNTQKVKKSRRLKESHSISKDNTLSKLVDINIGQCNKEEEELTGLIEASIAIAAKEEKRICDNDNASIQKSHGDNKAKRKQRSYSDLSIGSQNQKERKKQKLNEQLSDSMPKSKPQNERSASRGGRKTILNSPKIPSAKVICTGPSSLSGASIEKKNQTVSTSRSNSTILPPRRKEITFVRKSNTAVMSTSSKAGLSIIKNSKLKRLWPDSFVFVKKIMKWSPPEFIYRQEDDKVVVYGPVKQIGKREALAPIPATFRDSPDIIKHISPHILEEGINSLHKEFLENSTNSTRKRTERVWTRNIFKLFLRSCTPVEAKASSSSSVRLYEFAFHLGSEGMRPPTNLGELFAIYSPSWKQPCLGFIGSNDINSTFLSDQKTECEYYFDLCKLWISVSNTVVEHSGWLPKSEMVS